MYRSLYSKLIEWQKRPSQKPLILQGARQVGKTWLMKEFGNKEYEQTAYFNFEISKELHSLFKSGFDISNILSGLEILCGFKIKEQNTLIIFDEIQACPEAISSLKYFCEANLKYHVIAAGSLLGVSIHQGTSFPVGKVEFIQLHPMDFHEFLHALDKVNLLTVLKSNNFELIHAFHYQFIELLKQYFFVGGMPEVVKSFALSKDFHQVRNLQQNILLAYENDFSKHAPLNQIARLRMVWQSIVGQLAKENSKFIYNQLRSGARAKDFEIAIEWLKDAGLIQKVFRIKKSALPIESYADLADFKIYLNDIGLMCAMGNLHQTILLKDHHLFTEFKGIITEQFVLQQLIAANYKPFYWSPETGISEVDFVIQRGNQIIPIEVKSNENLKSRSLSSFFERYKPETCIRTSLAAYKKQEWMENIPLYGFLSWLESELYRDL
ncbi:MAG: ATP-binding protein [Saprospiraceae bacterium]|nr:ATP-binding protein [Saprospiraceae bacterium]MBK9995043.1 ATP-binding protein [Saprospiraceae bacterium]